MGDRIKNCVIAIEKIAADQRIDLKSVSSFYNTSPVSQIRQDDFVNCAILVTWEGTPHELLRFLASIEDSMGRTRELKDGPRIIDLDILLFGDTVLNEPYLTIPHAALHRRRFAMIPCLEIEPGLIHPLLKRPLGSFLADTGEDQIVTRIPATASLDDVKNR